MTGEVDPLSLPRCYDADRGCHSENYLFKEIEMKKKKKYITNWFLFFLMFSGMVDLSP